MGFSSSREEVLRSTFESKDSVTGRYDRYIRNIWIYGERERNDAKGLTSSWTKRRSLSLCLFFLRTMSMLMVKKKSPTCFVIEKRRSIVDGDNGVTSC